MHVRKEFLHFCRRAYLRPYTNWYQKPTSQLKTVIVIASIGKLDVPCYMIGICHDRFAETHNARLRQTMHRLELRSNERLRESLERFGERIGWCTLWERRVHVWSIIARGSARVDSLRGKRISIKMFQRH